MLVDIWFCSINVFFKLGFLYCRKNKTIITTEKSVSYICEEYYFLDFQLVFRNNCFNIIIHYLICSGYPPRGKQNKTMITKVQGLNIFCAEHQACHQVGKTLQMIHGCSEISITNWLQHKSSVVVS